MLTSGRPRQDNQEFSVSLEHLVSPAQEANSWSPGHMQGPGFKDPESGINKQYHLNR